jgi:hypothetical protein
LVWQRASLKITNGSGITTTFLRLPYSSRQRQINGFSLFLSIYNTLLISAILALHVFFAFLLPCLRVVNTLAIFVCVFEMWGTILLSFILRTMQTKSMSPLSKLYSMAWITSFLHLINVAELMKSYTHCKFKTILEYAKRQQAGKVLQFQNKARICEKHI